MQNRQDGSPEFAAVLPISGAGSRTYSIDDADVVSPPGVFGDRPLLGMVQVLARAGTVTSFSANYAPDTISDWVDVPATMHVRLFSDHGVPAGDFRPVAGVGCDLTFDKNTPPRVHLRCSATGLDVAVSPDERLIMVGTITTTVGPYTLGAQFVDGYLATSLVVR